MAEGWGREGAAASGTGGWARRGMGGCGPYVTVLTEPDGSLPTVYSTAPTQFTWFPRGPNQGQELVHDANIHCAILGY